MGRKPSLTSSVLKTHRVSKGPVPKQRYMKLLDDLDQNHITPEELENHPCADRFLSPYRLHVLEQLVATGHLNRPRAVRIMRKHPVLPEESEILLHEVQNTFNEKMGLNLGIDECNFADHVYWKPEFSLYTGMTVGGRERGIKSMCFVPEKGSFATPLAMAYAYGKEYAKSWVSKGRKMQDAAIPEFEYRGRAWLRRSLENSERRNKYWVNVVMQGASDIRRGLPFFFMEWYAEQRDAQLKTTLYKSYLQRISASDEEGSIGAIFYRIIYNDGDMKMLKRAMKAATNDELRSLVLEIQEKRLYAEHPTSQQTLSARS